MWSDPKELALYLSTDELLLFQNYQIPQNPFEEQVSPKAWMEVRKLPKLTENLASFRGAGTHYAEPSKQFVGAKNNASTLIKDFLSTDSCLNKFPTASLQPRDFSKKN